MDVCMCCMFGAKWMGLTTSGSQWRLGKGVRNASLPAHILITWNTLTISECKNAMRATAQDGHSRQRTVSAHHPHKEKH